ncbi:hypothetical protein ACKI2D_42600 [Streptomyces europaeiscabiei]
MPGRAVAAGVMAETLSKPRLLKGLVATTRDWNTVVKLAELTGAG